MDEGHGYRTYVPFFVEVDTGCEYSIEKIAVCERDLLMLVQDIKLIQSPKVTACFGESAPVHKAVSHVLQEDWRLSCDENSSIHFIIKEELIILVVVVTEDFLTHKNLDKESILVTVFRYLQDLSPVILHCPGVKVIENLYAGPKNPFWATAHTKKVFRLEKQEHKSIQFECIETNVSILQRECSKDFVELVLNDNCSSYFLHSKLETYEAKDVESLHKHGESVTQKLLAMAFEHKPASIHSLLSDCGFRLSSSLFDDLTTTHQKYVDELLKGRKQFDMTLRSLLEEFMQTLRGFRSKKFYIFNGAHKYNFQDGTSASPPKDAVFFISDFLTRGCVQQIVSSRRFDDTELRRNFQEVLFNTIFIMLSKPDEKCRDHLREDIKKCFSEYGFRSMLRIRDWEKIVTEFQRDFFAHIEAYIELIKESAVMRLTPGSVNVIQDNDGRYQNLTFSPLGSPVIIEPAILEKHFRNDGTTGKEKRGWVASGDEIHLLKHVTVREAVPLNNGRSFLILLTYSGPREKYNKHVLFVISNSPPRKVTSFHLNEFILLVKENAQTVTLFIIDIERLHVHCCEINESWKYKPLYDFGVDSKTKGKIVSGASFAEKNCVLLLTDTSTLYQLNLESKDLKEIFLQENTDRGLCKKRLIDERGNRYTKVDSLKSENFFALRNDVVIDIFDWNLQRAQSFHIPNCVGIKIFSDNINVYLCAVQKDTIQSYILKGLSSKTVLSRMNETKCEQVQGNPVIDIIYASFLKYGPCSDFIGAPRKNEHWLVVDTFRETVAGKLKSYLATYRTGMEMRCLCVENVGDTAVSVNGNYLQSLLLSRAPIHICTIEENNLMPLIDGKRQKLMRNQMSISKMASFITFSHLETVLKGLPKDRGIRVISIIGRQSSGKSYLLNRLFGTRFSVAATRCTDGIWFSYARIFNSTSSSEQDFIVLDCEGLFSISRNEQEEVKLLTVLAAISDVTILNQDLNFNRYINRLFNNLNNAVDRIHGSNYFEGLLMMAIRDVSSTEGSKAAEEFERNVRTLNQKGEHKFLERLFKGTMVLHCLNNYNDPLFGSEIDEIRSTFFEFDFLGCDVKSSHWQDGSSLVQSLKVVLLQLYSDDEQSADEHIKQIKQNQLETEILSAWGQISKVGEGASENMTFSLLDEDGCNLFYNDSSATEVIVICQSDVTFEVEPENPFSAYEYIFQRLYEVFFGAFEANDKCLFNKQWSTFNEFLTSFTAKRLQCLEAFAKTEINKLQKLLSAEEIKIFLLDINEKIRAQAANYSLCLETCDACYLRCIKRKGHKEDILKLRENVQQKLELIEKSLSEEERTTAAEVQLKLAALCKKQAELQTTMTTVEQHLESALKHDELLAKEQMLLADLNLRNDSRQQLLDSRPTDIKCWAEIKTEIADFTEKFGNDGVMLTLQSLDSDGESDNHLLKIMSIIAVKFEFIPGLDLHCMSCELLHIMQSVCKRMREDLNLEDDRQNFDESILNHVSQFLDSNSKELARAEETAKRLIKNVETCQTAIKEIEQSVHTLADGIVECNKMLLELSSLKQNSERDILSLTSKRDNVTQQLIVLKQAINAERDNLNEVLSKEADLINMYGSREQMLDNLKKLQQESQQCQNDVAALNSEHQLLCTSEEEALKLVTSVVNCLKQQQTSYGTDAQPLQSAYRNEWDANYGFTCRETEKIEPNGTSVTSEIKFNLCERSATYDSSQQLIEQATNESCQSDELSRREDEFVMLLKRALLDETVRTLGNELITLQLKKDKMMQYITKCENRKQCADEKERFLEVYREDKLASEKDNLCQNLEKITEEELQVRKDLLKKEGTINIRTERLNRYQSTHVDTEDESVDDEKILTLKKDINKLIEAKEKLSARLRKIQLDKSEVTKRLLEVSDMIASLTESPEKYTMKKDELLHLKMKIDRHETNLNQSKAQLIESEKLFIEKHCQLQQQFWDSSIQERKRNLQTKTMELDLTIEQWTEIMRTWTNLSSNAIEGKHKITQLEHELIAVENNVKEIGCDLMVKQTQQDNVHSSLQQLEVETSQKQTEFDNRQKCLCDLNDVLPTLTNAHSIVSDLTATLSQRVNTLKTVFCNSELLIEDCRNQKALILLDDDIQRLKEQHEQTRLRTAELEAKITAESSVELKKRLQNLSQDYVEVKRSVEKLQIVHEANKTYSELNTELIELGQSLKCFCPTDHKCDKFCQICFEDKLPCKHAAGHESDHICSKDQHDCPEKCEICGNPCMYAAGHTNPVVHRCDSTHQCSSVCDYCSNTCAKSLVEAHDDHRCNEKRCPKRCFFSCSNPCCGPHDHDQTVEFVTDPDDAGREIKLHLCDQPHLCSQKCAEVGVCQLQYVSETREWTDDLTTQEYEYIKPVMSQKDCAIVIPAELPKHEESHNCTKQHMCDVRCPECGSFCKELYGHSGTHKTITHRNKEFCICVSKTESKVKVEGEGSGRKARLYQPGEKFILETCRQQCARKGRAHYHLVTCRGGVHCAEQKYPDGAKHCSSDERFYPDLDKVYDKLLCERFWSHYNWSMPCEDKSVVLCNYFCPHSSHDKSEVVYCDLPAWHTNSDIAKDHQFKCHDFKKVTFAGLQLCFCIDTTISMGAYIKESKAAIKMIINDSSKSLALFEKDSSCLSFAVVGYADHCDGKTEADVVQQQPFTTAAAAINFLDQLREINGFDYHEAVIDGLVAADNLPWQTDTLKIIYHILDAPPHGRQFGDCGDNYPDGCPCDKKEDVILKRIRSKGINYYVVPLTNDVNLMISEFEKYIPVKRLELSSSSELSTILSLCTCKAIEDSEFTATLDD